MSANIGFLYT